MTNSQRLDAIRRHLQAWFATQTDGQPWQVSESILIRNGFYCGRCFQLPGFRAVWFFEEEQLKVYCSTGELLETFSGNELFAATAEAPLPIDVMRMRVRERSGSEKGADGHPVRRAA